MVLNIKGASLATNGLKYPLINVHCHRRVTNPRIRVITCRAQGNGNTKVSPLSNAQRSGKLSNVLSVLALTGASTGTLLDGIHSRVHLLVYDSAPFIIGGLHTSAWVPPLLASLYCVLGGIVLYADYRLAPSDSTTQKAMKHASLSRMAISFAALAAMLELSAVLYTNNVGSSSICVVLAACASLNYLIFDSTKQGLALAVLCALGAPAIEVILMQSAGLWHYPESELLPQWVPFCYFFYVPAVSNFSRFLWKVM